MCCGWVCGWVDVGVWMLVCGCGMCGCGCVDVGVGGLVGGLIGRCSGCDGAVSFGEEGAQSDGLADSMWLLGR